MCPVGPLSDPLLGKMTAVDETFLVLRVASQARSQALLRVAVPSLKHSLAGLRCLSPWQRQKLRCLPRQRRRRVKIKVGVLSGRKNLTGLNPAAVSAAAACALCHQVLRWQSKQSLAIARSRYSRHSDAEHVRVKHLSILAIGFVRCAITTVFFACKAPADARAMTCLRQHRIFLEHNIFVEARLPEDVAIAERQMT